MTVNTLWHPHTCLDATDLNPLEQLFRDSDNAEAASDIESRAISHKMLFTGVNRTSSHVPLPSSSTHLSHMIAQLKQYVGRRKQRSYVFTQASKKPKALKFWKGRLTQSKWANVFVALMHQYCDGFQVVQQCVVCSAEMRIIILLHAK